jgi:hypothetical protein
LEVPAYFVTFLLYQEESMISCIHLSPYSVLLIPLLILPMPDICQGWKKEGSNLTRKERFSPLVGGTIGTNIAYAFIVVAVTGWVGTGDIKENFTAGAFLSHESLLRGNG